MHHYADDTLIFTANISHKWRSIELEKHINQLKIFFENPNLILNNDTREFIIFKKKKSKNYLNGNIKFMARKFQIEQFQTLSQHGIFWT